MTKHLGLVVVVAVVAWLLLRKKAAAAATPPAVAGTVTSGSKSLTIDTNVLSDTFGETIDANATVGGDVGAGGYTP